MAVTENFAENRQEARERFAQACGPAGVTALPFYAPTGSAGNGEPIVEVARLGHPGARHAIVVTGGSSEDEGLCAAGIQSTLLRERFDKQLPDDVALILVHAIAPPGLSGLDGVRREFGETPPARWSHRALAAAESRFESFVKGAADGAPEHDMPVPWQARLVCRIASRFLTDVHRVGLLDIRTGPSQYGEMELLSCAKAGSNAHRRTVETFGEDGGSRDVPTGGHPGELASGLLTALEDSDFAAAVLEFGTYSIAAILSAAGKRVFYPKSSDWREGVWQHAARIIRRGGDRLVRR